MEQHKTVIFQGKRLHYREEGKDNPETLVLVHGFLQSLTVWSRYLLSYMRKIHVITIDLPGHGFSEMLGPIHTMEMMADAVKAVLDECQVDRCVMVGHSLGGYVALAFAEKYPFMLRGLGLLHSHAMADSPEKQASREQVCQEVKVNRAGYILKFIPTLFDPSKQSDLSQDIIELQNQCLETKDDSIIAAQRGMAQRKSRLSVIQNLECPILFVYGKNDHRIPIEWGVSQAMEAKISEVVLLDDVAHMSFFEEAEYVKVRLWQFVASCYVRR